MGCFLGKPATLTNGGGFPEQPTSDQMEHFSAFFFF